jgi:hypothetical protein
MKVAKHFWDPCCHLTAETGNLFILAVLLLLASCYKTFLLSSLSCCQHHLVDLNQQPWDNEASVLPVGDNISLKNLKRKT